MAIRTAQPAGGILGMQQALGNRGVQRLLLSMGVQRKLTVNPPDDEYEQEAERVAERVMRMPDFGSPGRAQVSRQLPMASVEPLNRSNENNLQRQIEEEEEEEEELLQTKPAPGRVPQVTPGLQSRLDSLTDGGQLLSISARSFFEPRFNRDLSSVRVHNDSRSAAVARELNAQAFTRGRNVYFGAGRYQSGTSEGRRLLAHELTHTIQQQPGLPLARSPLPAAAKSVFQPASLPAAFWPGQRVAGSPGEIIQRQNEEAPAATTPPTEGTEEETAIDPTTLPLSTGRLDPPSQMITFEKIEISPFKLTDHREAKYKNRPFLRRVQNYTRMVHNQREVWKRDVPSLPSTVVDSLDEKIRTDRSVKTVDRGTQYIFKAPSRFGPKQPRYFIGTLPIVAKELTLPSWDRRGEGHAYHVDHIVELQLADDPGWANTIDNMELLDADINMKSGNDIKNAIRKKAKDFIEATNKQYGDDPKDILKNYHLRFNEAAPGKGTSTVGPSDFWTKEQIAAGEHLDAVRVTDMSELGGEGEVWVFPDPAGGVRKTFKWPGKGVPSRERRWLKPYVITSKQFRTEEGAEGEEVFGTLTFNIPPSHETWLPFEEDLPITVQRIPEARHAGFLNKRAVRDSLQRLRVRRASPIHVDVFDILPEGVFVAGQILPDIPLLEGTGIDLVLRGDELELFKEFTIEEFNVPPPFAIESSTFTIFAKTGAGIGFRGQVDFGIESVGEGYLRAEASTRGPFALEGKFSFDSNLFDPADIKMSYRDNVFNAQGSLGIKEGKIRGIKSANIEASYSEGLLKASGGVQPTVPGIEEGNLTLSYSETEGMSIGGSLNLTGDIPGIKGGKVEAEIKQKPEEERYVLTASGEAVPDIPGISAKLTASYDDGLFTIQGSAEYERGLLKGSILVGATNQPVEEGQPAGEPTNKLRAFGGGSVTVQIAPWLQGTIGVVLLENGELEVSGEVGLPAAVDLFPEKSIEKNIFTINIDIPILGVSVLGQRIGIFATIGGGLDASAGFGPGQLRELGLMVTYNPDREEETTVSGGARLFVPAHAGLRLFIRGGIGAGIPVVSATAGLEVGGQLGVEGALTAGVEVNWSPAQGLVLDAKGEIFAEPKFRFDITGFVLVEADLLFKTIELVDERWEFAAFEFGSGLRFGISFPIHYEEGEPFEVSLSDVEFEVPDIKPKELLTNLIKEIT